MTIGDEDPSKLRETLPNQAMSDVLSDDIAHEINRIMAARHCQPARCASRA